MSGGAQERDIPDQDHLLLELPACVELRTDFVIEVEQLLERFGLGGHDETNDVHQKLRHGIAVEHDGENALHGLDLAFVGPLLQLVLEIDLGRDIGRIVLVDQAVRVLEEGRHLQLLNRRKRLSERGGRWWCRGTSRA